MSAISKKLEKTYRSVLFRRYDPDGSLFYFSHLDFPEMRFADYSFKSKRGHNLVGRFYYYDNPKPERLIIFDHGMGNGHNSYFREIETLARKGYLVYSYDHTGTNESEGENIYGLAGSLSDLDDCINAILGSGRFKEENISVIGHSWGGYSALNILGFHPRLRSIVAMSGYISVRTMQKQILPFLSPLRKQLFAIERRYNAKYAESSALRVLAETDRDVLVIHSMDDTTVNYKRNILPLSRALVDKTNIEYLLVNGKGHNPHYTREAYWAKEECFSKLKELRKKGIMDHEENRHTFMLRQDWLAMTEQDEEVWEKIFKFLEK